MCYYLKTNVTKATEILNDANFVNISYVEKVKDNIENLLYNKDIPYNIKNSSLNTVTGDEVDSDKRLIIIPSEKTKESNKTIIFEKNNDLKIMIFEYKKGKFIGCTDWLENIKINTSNEIKILLSYKDDRIIENEISNINVFFKLKINEECSVKDLENYYFRSEKIEDIPIGDNAVGYEDFINSKWEILRENHSEIISRNEIIKDTSNTFNIYEYIIQPKNYNKTVFLTGGVHGDEYEGFYGLYYFIKNIIENGYKYKQLRDIALNTRFIVIPVLNPYGVENKTRGTSRIDNANNNYDVMFNATEYEHDGEFGFSENESKAVKLIADKYNGEIDLYFDFHTDFYDPQFGDYLIVDETSCNRKLCENLIIDEIKYLKDKYNFTTIPKPNLVNLNRRCSSFKYMDIIRKVPSAIIEVSTGRISPIGSSESITRSLNWYTNVIIEHIKNDTKKNTKNNGLEISIIENRLKGYSESVHKNISDNGLMVWLDYKDFNNSEWKNKAERGEVILENVNTKDNEGVIINNGLIKLPSHEYTKYTLFLHGKILSDGRIISSENDSLKLSSLMSSQNTRFNICQENKLMYSSLLKYNEEIKICIRSDGENKELFVDGEPFIKVAEKNETQQNLLIGNNKDKNKPINMKIKNILIYDRALDDNEIGFMFGGINE
ncbi:zinc carboxypeptidase [Clostridium phage phi24R]|uniref:Zinc carboxypeptidase n=1 Tax=Clostridium phage phi24R TaxID=1128071 RepID=G9J3I7_9CAUD|nr:zinc carboxypeptidase [Clostridium phage phi24R]AEW47852.1 zinc carboxypeptidase [Clostridium phage phi24R]